MKPSLDYKLTYKHALSHAAAPTLLSALMLLLSACAPPPPTIATVDALKVSGVLWLQTEGQRAKRVRVVWERTNHNGFGHDEVAIKNPIGSTVARIEINPQEAVLYKSDGTTLRAATGEDLAHKMFGIALPVQALGYWLQGQAAPSLPSRINDRGDLIQDGWTIRYHEMDAQNRVKTAHLQIADVVVKVRIDQWFN